MRLWRKLINWVKNGEKGQSDILRFFTFIIIALLIIAFIIPPLFGLFAPRLTTASAIELLQNQGYWVLAQDACYPGEFIPCVSDTQSLGSDTNRWKDLWLSAPTIYLGNVTLSNSGTQFDIDGQLVMHNAGKVWMEIQPDLDYATVESFGKPTQVYRGVSSGFSLPIYNDDNEELFISMDVPREWDGITDPLVHIHCYIPNTGDGCWISPKSYIDYNGWSDETLAYDSDKNTYAVNDIPATSWSSFIEFTVDSMLYNGAVFYARYDEATISSIDIDIYYDGGWNDLYQGPYEDKDWVTKSFGDDYTVNKYRIRFYNSDDNTKDTRLYETALCSVSGHGNFKLEVGWNSYNVGDNESVPDDVFLTTSQITSIDGSNKSYVIEMPLQALEMTTCDQLDLRLRRIEASNNEVSSEIIITHIGIQYLRDKLGEVTP